MDLVAYQYCQTPNFQSFLSANHIYPNRYYQDHLASRPELHHCFEDCEQRPPQYFLIPDIDALAFDLEAVQAHLEKLWTRHITVILVPETTSPTDPQNPLALVPADWAMEALPALGDLPQTKRVQQQDWVQLGSILEKRKRQHHAELGHQSIRLNQAPPTGQAPYGYRRGKKSYLIDLRAAPVVKGFYENFLLYGCLRSSVRFIASTYGKSISVSTAKRWLTHPVYRGHLRYQGEQIITNTHPALLSTLEAAQVDRLLKRNQRFAGRSASASRSLAGLVHCAQCNSGMTISQVTKSRTKKQYLYLRPKSCDNPTKCSGISYNDVLEQTIEQICDRLPTAVRNLPPMQDQIKSDVTQELERKSNLLEQVTELENSGILDQETAQLRRFKLKTELSTLQQSLADMPPVNLLETAKAIAIPEFWLDLSETERRFYLREFIRDIKLSYQEKDWSIHLEFVFEPPFP